MTREQHLYARAINQRLRATHTAVHRVAGLSRDIGQAETALTNLQTANAPLAQATADQFGGHLVLGLALPAAYAVDYFLFSPSVEFLVGGSLGRPAWEVELAKFVAPAAVLLVETGISILRAHAEDDAAAFGSRRAFSFWTVMGLAMALVMPAFAIATQMAARESLSHATMLLIAALGLLAFLIHAVVLFGGQRFRSAKAFFLFKLQQMSARSRVRRLEDRRAQARENVTGTFSDYFQRLNAYNTAYSQARIEPGPFDATARREINDLFGYEIIQSPPAAGGGNVGNAPSPGTPPPGAPPNPPPPFVPPPPPPPPPVRPAPPPPTATTATATGTSPNTNAVDGENEYLRQILESRIRQADAEVQV